MSAEHQAGPTSRPRCPTLRSSCDTCTASKVGCTKEKPTCARCEKRGFECSYSPARRVGRPMVSRRKPNGNSSNVEPTQTSPQLYAGTSMPNYASSDSWDSFMLPADMQLDGAFSEGATFSSTELDDLFRVPAGFSPGIDVHPDNLMDVDVDLEGNLGLDSFGVAAGDGTISPMEQTISSTPDTGLYEQLQDFTELIAGSNSVPPAPGSSSHKTSPGRAPGVRSSVTKSPCSCLTSAITCSESITPQGTQQHASLPESMSLDKIEVRLETAMEAVRHTLQCCGRDTYLLVVLSLIMFKALEWLAGAAAAAEQAPLTSDCKTRLAIEDMSGYDTDGESPRRLAVQQVLCKLAGVQELVNTLCAHLPPTQCDTTTLEAQASEMIAGKHPSQQRRISESSFVTSAFLKNLGKDLQDRYKNLAQGLIGILRE